MNSLLHDLECFDEYIRGGEPKRLIFDLGYYDIEPQKFKKNYHQIIINKRNLLKLKAEKILLSLNIPPNHWDDYLNLTVYNFLLKLSQDGYSQIQYILKNLDEKTAIDKFKWLSLASIVALAALSAFFSSPFNGLKLAVENFLATTIGFPIIGFAFTGVIAVLNFYLNANDHKRALYQRVIDNVFLTIQTALNVSAYILWILAKAPMTPAAGALFVIASAVDVFKELYTLIKGSILHKHQWQSDNPLLSNQGNCRYRLDVARHRNALLINLGASCLLLGIMAVWCFVPGGFIVTIGALLTMGIVYGLKHRLLKLNESTTQEKLQTALSKIQKEHELPTQEIVAANNNSFTRLPVVLKESIQPDESPSLKLKATF